MAFRNAFKILYGRFNPVWAVLLFMVVLGLVVGALSYFLINPVYSALFEAGILDLTDFPSLTQILTSPAQMNVLFNDILAGIEIGELGERISMIWTDIMLIFREQSSLRVPTIILFFVLVSIFRFLLGFYELPLYKIIEGSMSCDAKFGFFSRFIGTLLLSLKYVGIKLLYTTAYDALFYLILYYLFTLFTITYAWVVAPLILVFVIVFISLRYTTLAFFGVNTAVSNDGILKSFRFAFQKGFKHFFYIFVRFLLVWTIIILLNIFFGLFTFFVGLLFTIPLCMYYIAIMNMTLYYSTTGKRYYADGKIITPPTAMRVLQ